MAVIERNALAKRQDLADVISIADSKKTVFTSMVKKQSAPTNTLLEWPADNYPAPNTAGVVDEADVTSYENLGAVAAVLQTRVQINERRPKVSRLAQKVMNQAGVGRRRAFAKALAKGITMLKRDIETTALSDRDVVVGTDSVANQTRGLGRWIQNGAQGVYPVDAAFRTPTGSISTTPVAEITDDTITGLLQSIYDETGDSDMYLYGVVGSTLKRGLSRLTFYGRELTDLVQVRRFNQNAADAKITMKVDVLETDFGTVVLRTSSFINAASDPTTAASKRLGYFFPMDAVALRFAENPNSRPLPDMGGGPRALCEAIWALIVTNPLYMGKMAPSA